MRIENITKDNIKQLPDVELRNLKIRFIGIYDRYFTDPAMKKAVDLERQVFYTKYIVLRAEMKQRGIEFHEGVALDKEVNTRIFQKQVWGIDVPSLSEITIVKTYAAISGAFIKSPKASKTIDVIIRNAEENRDERLEKKLTMIIKAQMGKIPNFIYRPAGPDSSHIPLFDLILKAREETRKITVAKKMVEKKKAQKAFPIEKPEETENTIRIPVGTDCEVTATITIDKGQGISALYCGGTKKIRTFIFDKGVKAWTMATARAWIKEHSQKVEKQIAEKLEKKLSEAQQKDYDEESVLIRENTKKAKYPHKFKAAKWTHPNGHPRCIHCGDEERVDSKDKQLPCEKPITKFNIIKIDKKKQMVGGIVYEPDEVDTQGDYTDKKEIEKAMNRFMIKYATDSKRIKINHMGKRLLFPIIESFIPDHDTIKGDQPLKAGTWWLMLKVPYDKIWKDIESGKLTGFSMGGRARA
jgi:hypothetical protein